MELKVRNVNHALQRGVELLLKEGRREDSRNGPVTVLTEPLVTIYERPTERVLFSAARDANPFFHLVEAAWMLAGRSDVRALVPYVSRFGEYAENDGQVHGAYGARWRHWFGYDQVDYIVNKLRAEPNTRQCVLAMWDATEERDEEPTTGADDLRGSWRDRPCNTHSYFRSRLIEQGDGSRALDLTVCCRSNDMIWGAYGANAVHFSFLQEVVARKVDAHVGRLYQLSNNAHAYVAFLEELMGRCDGDTTRLCDDRYSAPEYDFLTDLASPPHDEELSVLWTYLDALEHAPEAVLCAPGKVARADLEKLKVGGRWAMPDGWRIDGDPLRVPCVIGTPNWSTFSRDVAYAAAAHGNYKSGRYELALELASQMRQPDWRVACMEWIGRHTARRRAT